MKHTPTVIAGLALALSGAPTSASNEFNINGFINAIGSISNSETGYLDGTTDNGSFEDTNLGIVLSKQVNSRVSVATQFHGRHENFNFDWGYVAYKTDADIIAKAGKIKYAGNMVSETLDIGTTYPWIRPPTVIYGEKARLSYESFTGTAAYYTGGDDIEYSAEFFVGEATGEDTTNERMLGAIFVASNDNIRAQFSFNSSIMQFIELDATNAAQVAMNGRTMTNIALALKAEYDIGTLFAEYSNSMMSSSQDLEVSGWYITAMRQFGSYTPHITYQSYSGMFDNDESSFILGLNKQLDASTVMKVELQFVDPTNGGFFESQPSESSVTVLNVALNIVF